ncbi:MAG: methyltransferase domain-containing protein [Dehalococcoidia bacterium]|nr:MAG: methyltransferase domain-containing protein [Dehalococcoidia bacterium]
MPAGVDRETLRTEVQSKYADVALDPGSGFHFHTGRPLADMLGYDLFEVDRLPSGTVESFAGTGNPLGMGALRTGERVLDVGCGAGMDTLLAALQVGSEGQIVAVDMTEAMLKKTSAGAAALGLSQVDTRLGYAEDLPIEDASVDVVISNGVINLCPDKVAVMREIARVLRPGGRIQIADIVVHLPISQDARDDIDLWAG